MGNLTKASNSTVLGHAILSLVILNAVGSQGLRLSQRLIMQAALWICVKTISLAAGPLSLLALAFSSTHLGTFRANLILSLATTSHAPASKIAIGS